MCKALPEKGSLPACGGPPGGLMKLLCCFFRGGGFGLMPWVLMKDKNWSGISARVSRAWGERRTKMSLVLDTDVSRGPTQTFTACIYEQHLFITAHNEGQERALYIYAMSRKARIRELGENTCMYNRISSMLQLDCYPSS